MPEIIEHDKWVPDEGLVIKNNQSAQRLNIEIDLLKWYNK